MIKIIANAIYEHETNISFLNHNRQISSQLIFYPSIFPKLFRL